MMQSPAAVENLIIISDSDDDSGQFERPKCKPTEAHSEIEEEPIAKPIWKGSFMIKYKKHSKVGGVRAHFSTLLSPKAQQEARSLLPLDLNLCAVPRLVVWTKSFEKAESIELYFFPERKRDGDGLAYDSLVNEMMDDDAAMVCEVENAKLLVFTSLLLPPEHQRFQGKSYLWGVFRPKELEESSGCSPVARDSKKRKSKVNKGGKKKAKGKSAAKMEESAERGYSMKKYKSMVYKENISYDKLRWRINNCGRIQYARDVELKLSCEDWRKIVASPFGNVIKMIHQVSFSSQTVHYVLFEQLKTEKKWETWYEIGGKELRFSMKEFALITGLNCGPLPLESHGNTKGPLQVMKKFFDAPKFSVQDLYERFKNYKVLDNYKFKLGLLLIVEGIILGGDKKRLVKAEHVKLLDNMDKFWDYPWGRVAYQELHKSLTKSLAKKMLNPEPSADGRIGYTIQGMPVVFQVWILESVRSVGLQFASRLSETTIPRGLRWSSKECPEHGIVAETFSEAIPEVLPILLPEEAEKDLLSGCIFKDEVKHNFFDKIVSEAEACKKKEIAVPEVGCSKAETCIGDTSQMMAIIEEFRRENIALKDRIAKFENSSGLYQEQELKKKEKRVIRK